MASFFQYKASEIKYKIMAHKENKGGVLTNQQIEDDLKAKGKTNESETGHVGLQDTGDSTVRKFGTEVQRNEGIDEDEKDK